MDSSNPFCSLFGNETTANTQAQQTASKINAMEQKINGLIEHIFSITINRTPPKNKQLVFMEDLAAVNAETTVMNMEILEQALFERLLLGNPRDYLIPNNTQNDETNDIAEDKVILYLYRSYERLSKWCHNQNNSSLNAECETIKQLILRNASTAQKQPELYDNQSLSEQWLSLFRNYQDEFECKCEFLSKIVADVAGDNEPTYMESLRNTFDDVFSNCLRLAKSATLITLEKWVLYTLKAFVSDKTNAILAQLLLNYTTPKARVAGGKIEGIQFSETLLGALLSLSILPKSHNGPYEYFENMADAQSSSLSSSLGNYLTLHLDELHAIVKGFLLVGGETRNQMLEWIGLCLHSNAARGQIWNAHNPAAMLGAVKVVPDSFMIGLCGVLLRLCKPLLRPNFKVRDVDPTYFAVTEADRDAKSVHMHSIHQETCLIPAPDENQARKTADTYNFVTEVFYMTHKAIDMGYRVCIEKFSQMNREMARLQDLYRDAATQGGSEVAQNVMDALKTHMPKYLCLQKTINEPTNDQYLLQFFEATSLWLTRCASRIPDPENPSNEIIVNDVNLPIETPAPQCLSSIPEFLLENIVVYLTFIQHFEQQTIDTDLDTQRSIFTVLLLFMGDMSRARNPHLRARLAEGLASFLPKKCTSFSCSSKSHLFTQHPHRLEIVPNLLSVFVGIEMTGQSVQFEMKFNYRRPMYQIMEHLWELEEQRQRFRDMALLALKHMEDVNPPLFLRFINLLINDAIFLLDESLSNLQQIRQLQVAQDNGEWNNLPANEREQNRANLQHVGHMARLYNVLGRDTINILKLLTSAVPEIFGHLTMVDRVAAMLNYFLLNLTGPNQGNFKVKDKKEFEFDPSKTVLEICQIYINLDQCAGFRLAVVSDGRSYSSNLFEYAQNVLVKIGGGQLVGEISDFAGKVSQMEEQEKENQKALEDAPDDFLDPIMSTLMTDPVILPSSKVTCDRTTIARHLLSDQTDPFNREPLTMDQVKSDTELKEKIDAWIRERKSHKATKEE
ncbi:ubiquitin conjugation factor E4 A [Contarinia nasturtii]|uniref:ubiquitin conjugation factor E4 A n=1 Tax=Contarinia nasturtii TaxID=265458 RepID=UPI0012D3C8CF|nr:ubiquitin conjugation factor E4 A [Contarinia nasturtii]XP_031636589.1 ubiquitin conjugation factor E4 A [Contarinia nasturtii]